MPLSPGCFCVCRMEKYRYAEASWSRNQKPPMSTYPAHWRIIALVAVCLNSLIAAIFGDGDGTDNREQRAAR
jgi:hypothetical protein